jgi:hypothetical protein
MLLIESCNVFSEFRVVVLDIKPCLEAGGPSVNKLPVAEYQPVKSQPINGKRRVRTPFALNMPEITYNCLQYVCS